jgi:hypothetical protein
MFGAGETKALEAETHEDFIRATMFVMRALDVPEELQDVVLTKYKALDKPPFNDKILTYRGLHVFRYVFARYAHNRRSSSKVSIARVYDDKGVVTFEDFLDPMWWNTIREELKHFAPTANTNKQPHNLVHNFERDRNNFRGVFHLIEKSPLKYFISQCVRIDSESTVFQNDFNNNTYIQVLDNKPDDNDEQKDLHMDTFFPSLKFWYFPEDVGVDEGPFKYAKRSTNMSFELLDWLYRQTNDVVNDRWDKARRRGHPEGSFRVTNDELDTMCLKAKTVSVRGNTLVIGNVNGFHGRSDVNSEGHVRRSVHGSIRVQQPFAA